MAAPSDQYVKTETEDGDEKQKGALHMGHERQFKSFNAKGN